MTKVLRASGLKLTLSWDLNNSASSEDIDLLATVVGADRVPVYEEGVGDSVHVRQGLLVDIRMGEKAVSIMI